MTSSEKYFRPSRAGFGFAVSNKVWDDVGLIGDVDGDAVGVEGDNCASDVGPGWGVKGRRLSGR